VYFCENSAKVVFVEYLKFDTWKIVKEPTTICFLVPRSWNFRAETNESLPCGLVGKLVARSWHFRAKTNENLPCGLVAKLE
jgi:hypothetical protein